MSWLKVSLTRSGMPDLPVWRRPHFMFDISPGSSIDSSPTRAAKHYPPISLQRFEWRAMNSRLRKSMVLDELHARIAYAAQAPDAALAPFSIERREVRPNEAHERMLKSDVR